MSLSLSEQIMLATLQIEMLDGQLRQTGYASGFIFNIPTNEDRIIPVLVTNRHVFEKCQKIRIIFTAKANDGEPHIGHVIPAILDASTSIFHPNPQIDLAVIPLMPTINAIMQKGTPPFYRALDTALIPSKEEWGKLDAIEDVTMVGYPKGLRDKANNLPIFRRGITATHPAYDFQNEPKFLVDMACFPGSSGSPVFLLNKSSYTDKENNFYVGKSRVYLLGIQHAVPDIRELGLLVNVNSDTSIRPLMQSFINLGVIIKSTELLAFIPILNAKLRH